MKVLGINTATNFGSIGLVDGDGVLGEYSLNVPGTHSERLMTCIDRLLTDTKVPIERIDGFAITLGPGSFTGLRIGISTVKGLAFATDRPVVGVSTLEALALNVRDCSNQICPILDARKRETYAALFRVASSRRMKRLTPDLVIAPRDLAELIDGSVTFLGDGLKVYGGYLKRRLGRRASFVSPELGYVRGTIVALMGAKLLMKGKVLDLSSFGPHYIRRSEAEIKDEERVRKNAPGGGYAWPIVKRISSEDS